MVEGVIEKAEALLAKKPFGSVNPEQLKSTIDDINTRYESLLNHMLTAITGMEETCKQTNRTLTFVYLSKSHCFKPQ